MRRTLWLGFAIALVCGGLFVSTRYYAVVDHLPRLSRAQRAQEGCPVASDEGYYYPRGALAPKSAEADALLRRFYTEMIAPKFGEPPLWCGEVKGDTFRLIHMGDSFKSLSVRATRVGQVATLFVAVLEGYPLPPPHPGPPTTRSQRRLSDEEWGSLVEVVNNSGIWNVEDRGSAHTWILELRTGTTYHFVRARGHRAFGEVEAKLMALAGLAY